MLPILMIRPQIVTDMLAECERDSATGSLLVARAIMVSEAFVCTVLKRKGKLLCKRSAGFVFIIAAQYSTTERILSPLCMRSNALLISSSGIV